MKLKAYQGIEIAKVGSNESAITTALLKIMGVERIEQLSLSEINDMNEMFLSFQDSIMNPKDIRNIRLRFVMVHRGKSYEVDLCDFDEIDLTLNAETFINEFNPGEFDRVTLLIACIYAPLVKKMFNFPDNVERVIISLESALRECSFEDIYGIYDFFLGWKDELKKGYCLSMRQYMKTYLKRIKNRKHMKTIMPMQSVNYLTRSRKHTNVLHRLVQYLDLSLTLLRVWYYNMMMRLLK